MAEVSIGVGVMFSCLSPLVVEDVGVAGSRLRTGNFPAAAGAGADAPKMGGKVRRLGIPTIADRVIRAALKLVLEPVFEADFRPCSYGFRPHRRAHDAIAEIHVFGSQGYRCVLDADIEACFDSIDNAALMDRVRRRVKDKRALALVRSFLKAGIMTELGEQDDTSSGTPQGGILSPLLAAIGLSTLDDYVGEQWNRRWGPSGRGSDGESWEWAHGDWSATRTTSWSWSTAPSSMPSNCAPRRAEVLARWVCAFRSRRPGSFILPRVRLPRVLLQMDAQARNGQIACQYVRHRQAGTGVQTEDQSLDPEVVASGLQDGAGQDQPGPA
jgi:hypothetical protein